MLRSLWNRLRRAPDRGAAAPASTPAVDATMVPAITPRAAVPVTVTGGTSVEAPPYSGVLGSAVDGPPPDPAEPTEEEHALACRLLERFSADAAELQALPATALEVLRLVSEPEVRTGDLLRTVQRDAALGWAVMQVAHSAAYQGVSEVQTLKAAVARIGAREVGRVAGMVAARALFHPRSRAQQGALRARRLGLYRRSVSVAQVSSALALDVRGGEPDRAYLGGLLHGVGRALGLRALAALAADGALPFEESDVRIDRVLGVVQADLAAEALRRWELPDFVRNLTTFESELGVPADAALVDVHAVRVPAALWALKHEPGAMPRAPWVAAESARALGLLPGRLRTLQRELQDAAQRADPMLDQLAAG